MTGIVDGQTVSIAAGTYNLTGLTDALYIPQGISNWTVRGATGNRNDVVIQGAGMTGSVTAPQVHFELRKGAKPVNPLDYLAGA